MEPETKKAPAWANLIATFFGLGYARYASGTVGSIGAIVVYLPMAIWLPWYGYLAAWLPLFALAVYTSHLVQTVEGVEDPKKVVIDEVAGFLVAMFLLPVTVGYVAAGFLIFRVMDIVKPWPASYFDQEVKNGFGVVLDDVVAGVFTNVMLQAALYSGLLSGVSGF